MTNSARMFRTVALAGALPLAMAVAAAPSAAQSANPPKAEAAVASDTTTMVRGANAIVNGEIITGTDIDQRLALVLAANQNKVEGRELEQLREQVQRNLIDEMLEIQEARASEIDIPDSEVDATYIRVATQNFGLTPEKLDEYLGSIGSSPASMKQQIRGELAWQRLLRRNVAPFINVSTEEVNERLERLKADRGTEEYRLGEIFLAATRETKPEVLERLQQIVDQLRQGGSFVAYARQYSQASTAAVGGDLGWVRLGQLPPELAEASSRMEPGQLAGPIELQGGYSLLYLIDKRQVLVSDPRDGYLDLKQIALDFPKGTTPEQATKNAGEFASAVERIQGCDGADSAAQAIGATVVTSDNVPVRNLPGPLQETLLQLPIGGISQPFGSVDEGVRVLMVCGRHAPEMAEGPTFDELMAQIEDERINKRAQIYLRDLRRDAVIEFN